MDPAKRLEDLIVWQLARELRDGIGELLARGAGGQNWTFRDQIGSASSSTPANIAEGFGYFRPRLFAKHLRIARASAMETLNFIGEAEAKKYFTPQDALRFRRLSGRILRGVARLTVYLDSCEPNLDLRPTPPRPRNPKPPRKPRRPL